jgi:hypothetical protein
MLPITFAQRGKSTFRSTKYWFIDDDSALMRIRIIVMILTTNTNSTPIFDRSVPGGFTGTDTLERNIFGECDRNPSLIRNLFMLYNTKSVAHVIAIINNLF